MTEEQMQSLESCRTAIEWRKACDEIKASSPSKVCYPDDWFEKVVQSGLMDRVTARWGGSSGLTLTSHDNLADAINELTSTDNQGDMT